MGAYSVVATVNDPRYQGQATASITIGKATLTVTPDPISLTVGSPVPTYTFKVTGFQNDESAATAAGYVAPVCSSTYTTTTPISSSPLTITCSGGSAANYTFDTTATAQLTITATPTTITSLTMTPVSPNPTPQFGDTVTLKADVSPSVDGSVTFRVNGNPTAGVSATVSGGVAQATLKLDGSIIPDGAGDYALTATFAPTSPDLRLVRRGNGDRHRAPRGPAGGRPAQRIEPRRVHGRPVRRRRDRPDAEGQPAPEPVARRPATPSS